MLRSRFFSFLFAVIFGLSLHLAADQNFSRPDIQISPKSYPFTFVGYGDIRFTNPANTEASDPVRRQALVQQIARIHPDFIVITGDIVLNGGSKPDWDEFQRETRPWRDASLKIFPVLGNHDVRGGEDALSNYFDHFPQIKKHQWYSAQYGNCLFLMLDSDSDHAPGSPQGDWLANKLNSVPQDVDFVFLAFHHPPYTKSSEHFMGGGHSARPEEQQLAHMLEEKAPTMRQKIIVLSGHVHNYERYEHNGVMYIVSGGGGATPYMINRSPGDFYNKPGPTYHYCTFNVNHSKLHFEMHKLISAGSNPEFSTEDQFDLTAGK